MLAYTGLADETQQASSLEKLVQDASAERDALLQHLSLLQKALEKQEVACLERESGARHVLRGLSQLRTTQTIRLLSTRIATHVL